MSAYILIAIILPFIKINFGVSDTAFSQQTNAGAVG
jgi:hypothetical protein